MAANFTSMKVGKGVNQDKFTNVSIGLHQLDIEGNDISEADAQGIESYLKHNRALSDVVNSTK